MGFGWFEFGNLSECFRWFDGLKVCWLEFSFVECGMYRSVLVGIGIFGVS